MWPADRFLKIALLVLVGGTLPPALLLPLEAVLESPGALVAADLAAAAQGHHGGEPALQRDPLQPLTELRVERGELAVGDGARAVLNLHTRHVQGRTVADGHHGVGLGDTVAVHVAHVVECIRARAGHLAVGGRGRRRNRHRSGLRLGGLHLRLRRGGGLLDRRRGHRHHLLLLGPQGPEDEGEEQEKRDTAGHPALPPLLRGLGGGGGVRRPRAPSARGRRGLLGPRVRGGRRRGRRGSRVDEGGLEGGEGFLELVQVALHRTDARLEEDDLVRNLFAVFRRRGEGVEGRLPEAVLLEAFGFHLDSLGLILQALPGRGRLVGQDLLVLEGRQVRGDLECARDASEEGHNEWLDGVRGHEGSFAGISGGG
jgi:hypothetical protein